MADNNMMKLALLGGAAYLAYTQGWLSFLGIGKPAVATPAPAAPNPNAVVGANTVSGIQARTIAAAHTAGEPDTLGVYEWNFYLNQVLAPLGKQAPGPVDLFAAAIPGFDQSQKLTSGQYFAVMGPALKAQLGLTGLGLYWVVQ